MRGGGSSCAFVESVQNPNAPLNCSACCSFACTSSTVTTRLAGVVAPAAGDARAAGMAAAAAVVATARGRRWRWRSATAAAAGLLLHIVHSASRRLVASAAAFCYCSTWFLCRCMNLRFMILLDMPDMVGWSVRSRSGPVDRYA